MTDPPLLHIESRDAIREQLPKLRELVSIPHNEITLDEWEHAREFETALSEYFAAIDIGSKKIANIQFQHPRGKTVRCECLYVGPHLTAAWI